MTVTSKQLHEALAKLESTIRSVDRQRTQLVGRAARQHESAARALDAWQTEQEASPDDPESILRHRRMRTLAVERQRAAAIVDGESDRAAAAARPEPL